MMAIRIDKTVLQRRKRILFGLIYGLILAIVTLVGVEALASIYAPSWPARALRALEPVNRAAVLKEPFKEQAWFAEPYNSWGMRDKERTIARQPGLARTVFVGDSFVESMYTPLSLPAAVEQRMSAAGRPVEAVNLGISGTNPRSYYYRIRDVALALSPDAVLLFIYAGNDFIPAGEAYSALPRLVDESPGGSLLGSIMPRTNWLLVNRLRLAEILQGPTSVPPDEEHLLYQAARSDGPLDRLADHVRKYRYPELPQARVAEILSRGDGRYWRITQTGGDEQEYLFGGMMDILVNWESRDFDVAKNRQDAARLAGAGVVEATLSWIVAADRLTRSRGVPLLTFLVPVGSVDPDYVAFWEPWPRAYSWNHVCDERLSRLAAQLDAAGVRYVDLRRDLDGVRGTYRKLDGHWTRKGAQIVVERVAQELRAVLAGPAAPLHDGPRRAAPAGR